MKSIINYKEHTKEDDEEIIKSISYEEEIPKKELFGPVRVIKLKRNK